MVCYREFLILLEIEGRLRFSALRWGFLVSVGPLPQDVSNSLKASMKEELGRNLSRASANVIHNVAFVTVTAIVAYVPFRVWIFSNTLLLVRQIYWWGQFEFTDSSNLGNVPQVKPYSSPFVFSSWAWNVYSYCLAGTHDPCSQ